MPKLWPAAGCELTDSKSRQMVDLVLCARKAIWRLIKIRVEKVEQKVSEFVTSSRL